MRHAFNRPLLTACLFLLPLTALGQDGTVCAREVTIKKIYAGYVSSHKGPDNGNSVMVTYRDDDGKESTMMLNVSYNLNDASGASVLSMLMLGQTTGQRMSLHDHLGTRCDDFDEVVLHGY